METLDFTPIEWRILTNQEKRIVLMIRKYNMTMEEVKSNLVWPLAPMNDRTFSNHWGRIMKKISKIRLARQTARQDEPQFPIHESVH